MIKIRDDDGKGEFAMHSDDDIAVAHSLSPSSFNGKASSHSRDVMMAVDDGNDESAIAVISDVL